MKRLIRPVLLLLLAGGAGYYFYLSSRPVPLVLTGIVTTDDVVVSPQLAGRVAKLAVREGDTVKANQILAELDPGELQQEQAFYTASAQGAGSQVQQSTAALRLEERQVADQIRQAEANLAAVESQQAAAQARNDLLLAERQLLNVLYESKVSRIRLWPQDPPKLLPNAKNNSTGCKFDPSIEELCLEPFSLVFVSPRCSCPYP